MTVYATPRDERLLREKHGHPEGAEDIVECSDGTWRPRRERNLLDKDCPAVQAAVRAISKGPR